jgi:hypothetical protein
MLLDSLRPLGKKIELKAELSNDQKCGTLSCQAIKQVLSLL